MSFLKLLSEGSLLPFSFPFPLWIFSSFFIQIPSHFISRSHIKEHTGSVATNTSHLCISKHCTRQGWISIAILPAKELRHREESDWPKITQQINGQSGNRPQVPQILAWCPIHWAYGPHDVNIPFVLLLICFLGADGEHRPMYHLIPT